MDMNRRDFYKRVSNIYEKCDVEFKGVHACRNCFGMKLYRQTKDIIMTGSLMGHRSVTSTEVYVRAISSEKRNAVEILWQD